MYYSRYLNLIKIVLIYQLSNVTNAEPLKGHNISPADPNEFPFVVSLGKLPRIKPPNFQIPRLHFCAGVLISKRHILTSAHCVDKRQPSDVDAIVGEVDLQAAKYRYKVRSWITFNSWAQQNNKSVELRINDIAIITLSSAVDRAEIEPASLTDLNNEQLQGRNAVIAGWGATNLSRIVNVLQKAKVRILTDEERDDRLNLVSGESFLVTNNYLATAADPYTLAGCGDSGGPLLDENNQLLGIIHGTCPSGFWGPLSIEFLNTYQLNVYNSVNYYREFIVQVAEISWNVESNDV